MATINPFAASDAFNLTTLTDAFNIFPIRYSRVQELLGIVPQGVTTRTVMVENNNGVLSLLPTAPVGGEPILGVSAKRQVRSFIIPHIPHADVVLPADVANRRALGTEGDLMTLNTAMAQKLDEMASKHDITYEHHLIGMLKGIVLDADGTTIYDWNAEFGVSAQLIDFALDVGTTDVQAKILQLKRLLEDGVAEGDIFSGFHVLCSEEFFGALIAHANVKAAFDRWQDGALFRSDPRSRFEYCGVMFEEYRGKCKDSTGAVRRFIAANEAHAFPIGTRSTFRVYAAPAEMMDTVNTVGKLRYAKQEPRKFDRGTDLWTESNPLAMCMRPKAICKLTI